MSEQFTSKPTRRWRRLVAAFAAGGCDAVLADIGAGSESHAELLAIRLIRQAGLPEPRRQATIVIDGEPRLVDLYWDELDAGAEILGGTVGGVVGADPRMRDEHALERELERAREVGCGESGIRHLLHLGQCA